MILGLSISAFTTLHVVLSLVGIASGLVVATGLAGGGLNRGMAALFLATTLLTSVTGFFFPASAFLPSHAFGVVSLIALAAAIYALYAQSLAGGWGRIFIVGGLLALYLNVFVGVVQAFQKLPAFNAWAPTQTEPAFFLAQAAVLLAMAALSLRAWKRLPAIASSAG